MATKNVSKTAGSPVNVPTVLGMMLVLASSVSLAATIDKSLEAALQQHGFKGDIESTLAQRLGRPVDPLIADIGRNLFFDRILGLANDNSCSGCHAPQFGFADSQSIAIGVGNNCVVGSGRTGKHNQRRSPTVANAVLYPVMMWNGRFSANSGDPFDNSQGFLFPLPEADTKFAPYDRSVRTLMAAQGHMPPTELVEMAGTGTYEGQVIQLSRFGGAFATVKDGALQRATDTTPQQAKEQNLKIRQQHASFAEAALPAGPCGTTPDRPPPNRDPISAPNEPIRLAVLKRLQDNAAYSAAFAQAFPGQGDISFSMVGTALAEFQMQLLFANAPIDRFAKGDHAAMTPAQKRGALIFFGKAHCVSCHAVSGRAQDLFSDFEMHNIGVPPLYPVFNSEGNVEFKGPKQDRDLGMAEFTDENKQEDWYRFRTSPLRNVGLQPTFMHNGAYTSLEAAIDHHLDPVKALMAYDPAAAGVRGLRHVADRIGIVASLSGDLKFPVSLSKKEKSDLAAFVRDALTDDRARPAQACALIPKSLPSGNPVHRFEGC